MSSIPYVNLAAQWNEERQELLAVIERVLSSGQYVGGSEIEKFESMVGLSFGAKHVVAFGGASGGRQFGGDSECTGRGRERAL